MPFVRHTTRGRALVLLACAVVLPSCSPTRSSWQSPVTPPAAPRSECRGFTVLADQEWNSSGVVLEEGRCYRIDVIAICEQWKDSWVPATPGEGWTGFARPFGPLFRWRARYPEADMFVLVGSAGRDPSRQFVVGDGADYRATTTGELFLFANDWAGAYGNNRGRLRMEVCRSNDGCRAPADTPSCNQPPGSRRLSR